MRAEIQANKHLPTVVLSKRDNITRLPPNAGSWPKMLFMSAQYAHSAAHFALINKLSVQHSVQRLCQALSRHWKLSLLAKASAQADQ
ncbi:MAG: hypothetical protein ACRCZA_15405 [Shewanella sp.]|uniref:hypothetical protein n=1 Tax=Shewanella sp. TaxID=50422 RepID=UPI003F2E874E